MKTDARTLTVNAFSEPENSDVTSAAEGAPRLSGLIGFVIFPAISRTLVPPVFFSIAAILRSSLPLGSRNFGFQSSMVTLTFPPPGASCFSVRIFGAFSSSVMPEGSNGFGKKRSSKSKLPKSIAAPFGKNCVGSKLFFTASATSPASGPSARESVVTAMFGVAIPPAFSAATLTPSEAIGFAGLNWLYALSTIWANTPVVFAG